MLALNDSSRQDLRSVDEATIGINGILRLCNLGVACLIATGFLREELEGHPYVDWLTLVLGLALCLQTHVALWFERRRPDPFVLLMAYQVIFFYALRIFTLLLYPVQDVFLRYEYHASDSNFALLYILLANIALYAGFYRIKTPKSVGVPVEEPARPRVGLLLLASAVLFGVLFKNYAADSPSSLGALIFENFLTLNNILLVLAAYVIANRGRLPLLYLAAVIVGGLVLAITQTLDASRSAILGIVENLLVLTLVCLPRIRASMRALLLGICSLPILLAVATLVYAVATETRMNRGAHSADVAYEIEMAQQSWESMGEQWKSDAYFRQALSRAGYFDFAAELIANASRYESLFSAESYEKSVVDNLLTPGFDVFDYPKISNCLKYLYLNLGVCSKANEASVARYHTDQFGIYGEMYNLFGYGSLAVLFFIAGLLKKAFSYTAGGRPNAALINQVLLLLTFLRLMMSFGLDWLLINTVVSFASFHAILRLSVLRVAAVNR